MPLGLFDDRKRLRSDARELARAIRDRRISLAQAAPHFERAMELAEKSADALEVRYFMALMSAVQAFMQRAIDDDPFVQLERMLDEDGFSGGSSKASL